MQCPARLRNPLSGQPRTQVARCLQASALPRYRCKQVDRCSTEASKLSSKALDAPQHLRLGWYPRTRRLIRACPNLQQLAQGPWDLLSDYRFRELLVAGRLSCPEQGPPDEVDREAIAQPGVCPEGLPTDRLSPGRRSRPVPPPRPQAKPTLTRHPNRTSNNQTALAVLGNPLWVDPPQEVISVHHLII